MSASLCNSCQNINLYTLGAFHGSSDDADPITRTRDQLRDDCALCQLFLGSASSYFEERSAQEIEKVSIRADKGIIANPAHLSGAAWEALRETTQVILTRLWRPQYYPISSIQVTTYYKGEEDPMPPISHDVFLDDESTPETRNHACGRTVSAADSDENVERVSGWLKNCLKKHPYCRLGLSNRRYDDKADTTPLPDRVISVGTATEPPRLMETNRERGIYVALSYCWEPNPPGQHPFRLLQSNKSELESGINLSALSPTIQDAIDFTRRLGFHYIWIDRLCIIQDDAEDCSIHVVQMCDIYERASLTIAALAASSRGEGLYLPRQPRASVRIKCATKSKDLGFMHIALSKPASEMTRAEDEFEMTSFGQELSLSRWNTRGWVMQERVMSRRVVYFGRWQIFWECQEQTLMEDGIKDGSDVFKQTGKGQSRPKHDMRDDIASHRRRERMHAWFPWLVDGSRLDFWDGIVRDYTSRQLTFGTDKGKAMAGIGEAASLSLGISGGYAWGVFLPYADRLLLWHWKGSHLTAPETPRGPSWSWMSYDGRIRLLKEDWTSTIGPCAFVKHDEASAMGITVQLEMMEPAVLSVRGARLVPMVLKGPSANQMNQIETWLGQAMEHFNFATLRNETKMNLPKLANPKVTYQGIECRSGRVALSTDGSGSICGFVQFDLENQQPASGRIQCLIIGETTETKSSGPIWRQNRQASAMRKVYHILALEEIPSQGTSAKIPVYRRLGIAQTIWVQHEDFGFPIVDKATTFEQILII